MNRADGSTTAQDTLTAVLFTLDGRCVGVEARFVRSSHLTPQAAAGGEVEARLGRNNSDTPAGIRYCLSLKQPEGDRDILVNGPVELVEIPAAAIHPLPPLLAARSTLRGLRALALLPGIAPNTAIPLLAAAALAG
ncbi:MAG: hypothetical protein BWK76_13520 [Desulfobulbaceae bacterium A2]|nr:MAG: hypothetical protein BWK76_13520 [Desulfobulbaceae bacterium A2]